MSPLIGILVGLSSERIKKQKKSAIPQYKSKSFKLNKELNELEKKLKDIQKKRDLGIEPDDSDKVEKMKKRYVEIENLLRLQEGQKEKKIIIKEILGKERYEVIFCQRLLNVV